MVGSRKVRDQRTRRNAYQEKKGGGPRRSKEGETKMKRKEGYILSGLL